MVEPCDLDQVEILADSVEAERTRLPERRPASADAKLLDAIVRLAFDEIPKDPTRKEYRQGGTLGTGRKHWFRATFGAGRFRLFFRFRTDARILVYVWVNDQQTLRTYGDRDDAYATFARMPDGGNPPDDWDALLAEARSADSAGRAEALARRIGDR
ncbi:MAG TPA: type II toxin-antitoxin system YhaV family toxin [Longimicrobium sp.]|nr:type II toxin-antitoxin system YhaV family toxin [Longimicrobium sp.]